MTNLIACFHANWFVAELAKRTLGHLHVEAALEIFRESCEHLIPELTSAAEIFRTIAAVEAHIKPLNLQRSIGVRDVSLWEHLRDM